MDKRYQVFVSSTFKDLEYERQEVLQALLELECMPSGMELFPAANESQWNLIQRVIDECDYYILILGGRYGSIGPDGLSYTEMEYRYALSKKKPTIAFIHRDPGKIRADNSEQSTEGKQKLGEFRKLVEEKLCKHWDSPAELGSVVSRSLIQLMRKTEAIGWVRADALADSDATAELLQLRRRVEEMQRELDKARVSAPSGSEQFAQGDDDTELTVSFRAQAPGQPHSRSWNLSFWVTWNEIFAKIAPLMIDEAGEADLKANLDTLAAKKTRKARSEDPDFKGASFSNFKLAPDDFQTIKIQLRAVGLISRSKKTRSVKDVGTYWTLTPYGDEVMTRLRAIRRDSGSADEQQTLDDDFI